MNKRKRKKLLKKIRLKSQKEIFKDLAGSLDIYIKQAEMYKGINILYYGG